MEFLAKEMCLFDLTAPIITNGVPRKRNVFVRPHLNIHVQAWVMPEEMEQLVIVNIQNVNAQAVMFGMLHPVHVFVQVLINTHVVEQDMPEEREQLVMANIQNVNAQAVMFGMPRKELVSVMVQTGVLLTKIVRLGVMCNKAVRENP